MKCIKNGVGSVVLNENEVVAIEQAKGYIVARMTAGQTVQITTIKELSYYGGSEDATVTALMVALSAFLSSEEPNMPLREHFEHTFKSLFKC